MKSTLGAAVVFLAAMNASLLAQQHFPTNEDLRQLRSISSPQLSPDLKHVVVTVQDSTADGGKSHLWLLSTEDAAYRQLTFSQAEAMGERSPEYLPDGSAILFLSRRDGRSNLYRLPLNGGEAVALKLQRVPVPGEAAAAVDVVSYSISPDGSMVAVVASDPEPASRARDHKDKKDAIWVEHEEQKHHLYLMDSKTWKSREVPALTDIDSVSWTEQSDRLLILTHTHLRDLGPSTVGWIMSAQNPSEQKRIEGLPESTRRAVWMHHADGLVLFAKCKKDAPEGCSDLYTFDMASAKLHNLTADLKDSTLSPETLIAADDDRSALVSVTHGMKRTVAQIDLGSGHTSLLDFGLPVVAAFRQTEKAKAWVYMGSASTSAPAVYMTTALDQPGKRLVQPESTPAEWMSVTSKPVSWKRAGFTIEGLLYLPRQVSEGRVPLVVNVHGGPTGQFTDTYSPLTNLLVGQGWAVLITNPRGSTGYGVEFEAANKDDMGNGDYLDIMAGVDEVLRTSPVDAERMALIGYSYGGEMAGFVEGKTTRFKAIVSGAPVIDQFSEYGTESGSYGDRWFTGQPWRHFESAWRQSPIAYAEHAKTPFLLLQGQSDTTDPEGQSKEMYRALRQEGVPVQMLLFPREDHGALGGNFAGQPSTEPWHGVIARDHMIRFIADAFAGKVEPNQP
ncbi:dipeptidyl aminopeptidase/acylaminoacyl peptidase [Edaphobacter aggregans]|uniref:Dipeptidyl aminopeptidase/acylaminoacyl peptidase n=1 Tax=Edaphobacter aggregans TaxID=570835 RepID=A0A3R9WKG6_9BACT|nr:prolyl oligopeptidase family serine peptidase [Edaphobacter aggregans]RSL19184.1 dipeptidyl aminopeptidase/acylaminoacyl peptidase [Edaphobacter aggregans]